MWSFIANPPNKTAEEVAMSYPHSGMSVETPPGEQVCVRGGGGLLSPPWRAVLCLLCLCACYSTANLVRACWVQVQHASMFALLQAASILPYCFAVFSLPLVML